MKKFLCLVVTLSMLLSLVVPAMAVSAEGSSHGSITMMVEGKEVCFSSYEIDDVVYVSYQLDGEWHIVSRDKQTEEILLDNMPFISPYAYSEDEWAPVPGGVTESDIKTDVENVVDAASLLATLIAVVGGAGIVALVPKGEDVLEGVVQYIISEQLPTVYYRKTAYYEIPIVTSRPNLGYVYEFYDNADMDGEPFAVFDACV